MAPVDEDSFVHAFIRALSNETVITKLQNAVCGTLQKEVGELRNIIKSKDDQIAALENRISELEKKQDEAEKYSRWNSLRINGVKESESQDVVQNVINLFNDVLRCRMQRGSILTVLAMQHQNRHHQRLAHRNLERPPACDPDFH